MAEKKVLIAGCLPVVRTAMRRRAEDAGLEIAAEWRKPGADRQLGGGHGADVVLVDRAFLEECGWSRPEDETDGAIVIVVAEEQGKTDWFVEAGRRGATDYLAVPFAGKHLLEKIERAQSTGGRRLREVYGTTNLEELWKAAQPQRDVLGQDEIDALLSATEPKVEAPAGAPGGAGAEEGDELSRAMEEAMAEEGAAAPAAGAEGEEDTEALAQEMTAALQGDRVYPLGTDLDAVKGAQRRITSYDFKRPARINKDQLRTLENLHDQFCRYLSHSLSGHLRQVVDVDTAFVDQTTYGEFIMSLSNPCLSYAFSLGDAGRAIFDIAMPLVCATVDRVMGGRGSPGGVQARQVTPVEIQQMNLVAKRVIQDLEATWRPIAPLAITDVELETNPEFIQLTAASEIVILLAFEINTKEASGLVSLCYPFFTLEPLVHLFGRRDPERATRQPRAERRARNRLCLGDMDVELVAEVGRTRITAAEAASLAAGDVIRLDTRSRDPARVYVGGQPKFLGWPCEDDGEVKLRIAGRVPPPLAVKYGTVTGG